MVQYTCDVCGLPLSGNVGSSHRVDRYGLQLDLCTQHVEAWVNFAVKLLQPEGRMQATNHGLSRAMMDALVNEGSMPQQKDLQIPEKPLSPEQLQVVNLQLGIQKLHETVDAFLVQAKTEVR